MHTERRLAIDVEYLKTYAQQLLERRDEGQVIPYEAASFGSWAPAERCCYDNAARWCLEYPSHQIVRGWLHFPVLDWFNAHSIIRTDAGRLIDITPAPFASQRYPFIAAEESAEKYAGLVDKCGVYRIYPDGTAGRRA